ncbi:MAG: hypothetical protein ACO25N_04515 [Candidatus Limnocylindrus sp.]
MLPHLGPRLTPPLRFSSALLVALPLFLAGCFGSSTPTPTPSQTATTVISTEYGRVWGALPADFPLLASGHALVRLDVQSSGAIWSQMGVNEATAAAIDELRRLAWDVQEPTGTATARQIIATRNQGACTLTIVVEPLGTRTSLVVYLGEGCPKP